MKPNLTQALDNVEMVYGDISQIADNMTREIFDPIDNLTNQMADDINSCTTDEIRQYLYALQLKAFQLAEIKEKSAVKAECAEILRKEKYARSFNEAQGSAAVKENLALIEMSEQVVVETLYDLVASLFKGKQDALHRLVDALKSILMSRMQEAKLAINGTTISE